MLMKIERRSSFGWPAHPSSGTAPCKNGMVAHYDGSNLGLAKKSHGACRDYWQNTRRFHMGPSRRWLDIGYSFGVCPHGIVLEGRGFGYVQAAQPGGNATWTSCTFMTGDAERPTAAQLNAWRELRAWLRGKGVSAAVRGHKDFISTSCPGSTIYAMVKDGTLTGAATRKDDDMPDYVSVGLTGRKIDMPPGEWTTVWWDHEYSDAQHHHASEGGPSFVEGPARYTMNASVRIEGLAPGTELQARMIERRDSDGKYESGPIAEYLASGGATFVHYALGSASVSDGSRVRFQVVHYGTGAAKIVSGDAKALAWPL